MAKEEGEVLDGRDLMVYIDVGSNPETPEYEAQALATTHTVTWATETKERLTKDSRRIFLLLSFHYSQQ